MTVDITFKVAIVTALLLFIMHFLYIRHPMKKQNTQKKKRIEKITIISLISLSVVTACAVGCCTAIAKKHGYNYEKMSLIDVVVGINRSPLTVTKDELPSDLQGDILIFYKFGCPDCEAIYQDLQDTLENADNVYWIATNSLFGKELAEQYDVTEVPMGVYIRHGSYDNALPYTKKILYETSENQTHLNETAIERLLYLQKNQK